jgi:hypothetical protein
MRDRRGLSTSPCGPRGHGGDESLGVPSSTVPGMVSGILSGMATSTKGRDMEQAEKVRENRLRAMAKRQGRELSKSRRRDPYALDYGHWTIFEQDGTEQTVTDLDAVEAYLRTPKIEVELRRAGREYIVSGAANRDQLRPLVREAITKGMQPGAVEIVSGVPLADITELNREAQEDE